MNLQELYKDYTAQTPQKGNVLLAMPFIEDETFKRTVVFLVNCVKDETFGYILNYPLPLQLHDVIEDIPESDFMVGIGGPVSRDCLYIIHSLGNLIPNSLEIVPGLYWGGDFDVIRSLIKEQKITPSQIRFFMGYCGWEIKQLQEEIADNTWIQTKIPYEDILKQNKEVLWQDILRSMGGKFKVWAEFPEDPTMN